jgi:hypothetical protein
MITGVQLDRQKAHAHHQIQLCSILTPFPHVPGEIYEEIDTLSIKGIDEYYYVKTT